MVPDIYIYLAPLSAEGAKNVSWPWLSPLRGWGSLTMSLTGKFVYLYMNISGYFLINSCSYSNFQILNIVVSKYAK